MEVDNYERNMQRTREGFVCCDDPQCVAKVSPTTLDEFKAAMEHWRNHWYLYGCSHGN